MSVRIALAGNPNSGKTTLFNALTGANQYVGNWPGVTVEKKEGKLKGNKDVVITDLPGTYSLSPYTPEEVAARNYLIGERPDAILNIVDGTNLERNLYLTTQLSELGIPLVIAVNMMDAVKKSGDKIDTAKLSKSLGCPIIEISALRGDNVLKAAEAAVSAAKSGTPVSPPLYSKTVENAVSRIEDELRDIPDRQRRWYAIKLFERDENIVSQLKYDKETLSRIEEYTAEAEHETEDDSVSIITSERYEYISRLMKNSYKKSSSGKLSTSDKIDKIVTNRILALPIFAVVMWLVYTVSIGTIGSRSVGFINDTLFGEWIVPSAISALEGMRCAPWLISLISDGIIGGVGAVLGFVPQMLILFLLLSLLEDCGYMSRIAFIMDRIFRRFGLSGKSFIPLLVASGCGVPGVMASRTIKQDRDRKMTIMTTCFIPCGAKMPIVGLIAGALFGGSAWIAASAYFIGIGAVIVSGIILKKTKAFSGEAAPFVMELPSYRIPSFGNVIRSASERVLSFIKRAGTVIVAASIIIWVLNSITPEGGLHYITGNEKSILNIIGEWVAIIFAPLGFGQWQSAVATILGLVAKEEVVGVFGSLSSMANADLAFEMVEAGESAKLTVIGMEMFGGSQLSAYSFMIFNLLCAPCFAAMGAIRREMNSAKWTWAAISYMCAFAYAVSLMVYQFGSFLTGGGFTFWTAAAAAILAAFIYLLFRRDKYLSVRR